MGEGITHIISSLNAPWCAWTMLGLLLCAIFSEWMQPGVISQAHGSLDVRNDRMYKESPTNFMGQLLITLFRIGTVAMALCLCGESEGQYPYRLFWIMCGLVFMVIIVKMLCNILLDYTFSFSRRYGKPYEHYGNLWTLMTLVLYPILLVLLRFSAPQAARWIVGSALGVFVLLWLYRIAHTYFTAPKAILYVLLYICTLEILPFAGVVYFSAKMISML